MNLNFNNLLWLIITIYWFSKAEIAKDGVWLLCIWCWGPMVSPRKQKCLFQNFVRFHISYQIMLLYYVPLMFCQPMILRIRTNVNVLKNMVDKHYRFRPPILIDVSKIDMSTTVLGFKISMPVMIAPTAMQKMAHPEGIIAFSLNSLEFLKCKIKLFCFVQYFVRRKKFMKNQAWHEILQSLSLYYPSGYE